MLEFNISGASKIDQAAQGLKRSREVIADLIYKAAGLFGERATSTIKEGYLTGGPDRLKVQTGRLRSSIKSLVTQAENQTTVAIGTDVPYAPLHEFGGTQTIPITPKMRRWAWWKYSDTGDEKFKALALTRKSQMVRKVIARPFLTPGTTEEVPWLREQIDQILMRAVTDGLTSGQQ